jgi:outer membrane protein assembly factor BamB
MRTLYVGGYQGQLAAFDLRDRPETVWEYPVSTLQSLAEGLGNVYVAEADGVLVAVDAASGKAVWKQDALKGRGLSAPAVVAGVLAVGDAEGYLHLFSQADGKVLGRARTRGAVVSLQVMGERLLVSTDRGVTSSWVLPATAP